MRTIRARTTHTSDSLGFTLLEVMVAVALLSLGIVVLLQVQARSIQLAQQARNLSVATGLARAKLYDCEQDLRKKGFSIGDYDEEGRFEEAGFENFFWECHGYKPELPVPDATDIASGLGAGGSAGAGDSSSGAMSAMAGAGDAAGIGAGMIAPVFSQMAQVVGEAIRELVVIVRWKEGDSWEQLQVTTHLVDKTGIQQLAAGMSAATGGGGSGSPQAETPENLAPMGGVTPPPAIPGPGGLPGVRPGGFSR